MPFPMLSIRIVPVLVLLCAFLIPAAVQAAPLTVITREIRGAWVPVTAATVPVLSVEEAKGRSSLALSYRNMPEDAYLIIVRAHDNRLASDWNFPTDAAASGEVNAAIPSSLARGVYALRAIDPSSGFLLAESGTFRANGHGRVVPVSRAHQEATLRIFTGDRKYEQTLGLTRNEARRECRRAERSGRDGETVDCFWGDRSL